MPSRPAAEREASTEGMTGAAETQPDSTSQESSTSGADAPDLDDRERRQAPDRKPPGPGSPASPAPPAQRLTRGGAAATDDEALESWGRDPVVMPPADPEPS